MKTRLYADRAKTILKILEDEKISSPGKNRLDSIRAKTMQLAESGQMIAPSLTACVASTLLKVGLCQELAQRFILEYCIKYEEKNVSVIFLHSPGKFKKEDHALVYIGPLNVPDKFIIGRGNSQTLLNEDGDLTLTEFIKMNKEGLLADPLLNCSGISPDEIKPLLDYCEKFDINHVAAVRPFHESPNLIKNALAIKNNAEGIAENIKIEEQSINQPRFFRPNSEDAIVHFQYMLAQLDTECKEEQLIQKKRIELLHSLASLLIQVGSEKKEISYYQNAKKYLQEANKLAQLIAEKKGCINQSSKYAQLLEKCEKELILFSSRSELKVK